MTGSYREPVERRISEFFRTTATSDSTATSSDSAAASDAAVISDEEAASSNTEAATNPSYLVEQGESISILLLGIDTGDLGRTEQGRSDSMIVATINPNTEKTTLRAFRGTHTRR